VDARVIEANASRFRRVAGFAWTDYRTKGRDRQKIMTLATDEFIRRFFIHVLPQSFHRIHHYGLLVTGGRARNIARARALPRAVSSHEACPTPAGRVRRNRRYRTGVRQPFT